MGNRNEYGRGEILSSFLSLLLIPPLPPFFNCSWAISDVSRAMLPFIPPPPPPPFSEEESCPFLHPPLLFWSPEKPLIRVDLLTRDSSVPPSSSPPLVIAIASRGKNETSSPFFLSFHPSYKWPVKEPPLPPPPPPPLSPPFPSKCVSHNTSRHCPLCPPYPASREILSDKKLKIKTEQEEEFFISTVQANCCCCWCTRNRSAM